MTRSDEPSVAAIVLSWNNYPDSAETLRGLTNLDYDGLDVVLVDNGSTDGSADRLSDEFPGVELLALPENRGFPGGNNAGMEYALEAGYDYLWLLNNDLVIPSNLSVERLLDVLEAHEDVGAVSPLLTEYPETDTVWFRRGYIDRRSAVAEHECHHRWLLTLGEPVSQRPTERFGPSVIQTDYMPLCAALLDRRVVEEVGLLDDGYFLYGSDVDYFLRMARQGYVGATHEDSVIHHKVSVSSQRRIGPVVSYYSARNRLLVRRRYPEAFRRTWVFLFAWWALVQFGYRLRIGEADSALAFGRGLWDGLRNRTGRGPYP